MTVKKSGDSTVATKIEAKSAAAEAVSLFFSEKVDPSDDGQLWTMQKADGD